MSDRKVAFVTGASRGIGKAIAISLAKRGFDIAVTARTVSEGEGRVNTPFQSDQRIVEVPGSIASTVAAVEECGRSALGIRLDITKREDIDNAVAEVLDEWGHIDVLVNNALYQGPGLMYGFMNFSDEQLEASVLGNFCNQVHITRLALRSMLERGSGAVICLSSGAAIMPPPAPPDKGGWGFAYAGPKSAFHRIAEFVHVEHRKDGIMAFNVEPGYTVTESTKAMVGDEGLSTSLEATLPEETGEVVAWLLTDPAGGEYSGKLVSSPNFFEKRKKKKK